jgi:signal transduction histidine kinase
LLACSKASGAEVLRAVASSHRDPRRRPLVRAFLGTDIVSAEAPAYAQALALGRCIRVPAATLTELRSGGSPQLGEYLEAVGASSLLVVPLRIEGHPIGTLTLARDGGRPAYGSRDELLAEEMASRAALAIENARLYDEARRARAAADAAASRAAFLSDASRVLASSLDYASTLRSLADLVVPRLADLCVVLVRGDSGCLEQVAEAAQDPEKQAALRALRNHTAAYTRPDGFAQRALAGEPVFVPDVGGAIHAHGDDDPERQHILHLLRFRSVVIVPIRARGRVVGLICFGMAESGRASTVDDVALASGLAERAAAAIENARLYDDAQRAIAAAEEAVRAREDFLSIAGHELRTPVTALRLQLHGLLRAANSEGGGSALVDRATRFGRSIDRLARLIDELLDVSRVTTGRLALERSDVELGELVRDILARHAEQLAREGCDVRLTCAERVAGRWDRPRIEQVFTNILTNAAKYGRGRPIHVTVEPLGAGQARVSVRDHGIGIPEADLTRIFGRFERGDGARDFGGLGLGLWIAREIAEAHGGRIYAESVPGAGATFHVELPRAGVSDLQATPIPQIKL